MTSVESGNLIERNLRGIEVLIAELKQRLASLEAHAKQLRKLLTKQQ